MQAKLIQGTITTTTTTTSNNYDGEGRSQKTIGKIYRKLPITLNGDKVKKEKKTEKQRAIAYLYTQK